MYKKYFQEAEYQGKDVELNKPVRASGENYAFYVYVKDGDKVKKVTFGDPSMPDRRDNDEARKSFMARHKCDTAKDKTSKKYWSCKAWSPSTEWV